MADERLYEQKLTKLIKDWLYASRDVNRFVEASETKDHMIAKICVHMSDRFNLPREEAKGYINYTTGEFKPGRCMSYLLDPPQLIGWYKELQAACKTLNSLPFKTKERGQVIAQAYLVQTSSLMSEIKQLFGESKAKEIAARAKATAIKETGISF